MNQNIQPREYVLKASRPGKPDRFYNTDYQSGGYPVYLEGVGSALFMTLEEAEKIMNRIVEASNKPQTYTDGERRPALEISVALDLNKTCLEETVTFSIYKVMLEPIGQDFTFVGKIEKPIGFHYTSNNK